MNDLVSRQKVLDIIANYDIGRYGANKYLFDLIYEMHPQSQKSSGAR